jgi:hypothetical protein
MRHPSPGELRSPASPRKAGRGVQRVSERSPDCPVCCPDRRLRRFSELLCWFSGRNPPSGPVAKANRSCYGRLQGSSRSGQIVWLLVVLRALVVASHDRARHAALRTNRSLVAGLPMNSLGWITVLTICHATGCVPGAAEWARPALHTRAFSLALPQLGPNGGRSLTLWTR